MSHSRTVEDDLLRFEFYHTVDDADLAAAMSSLYAYEDLAHIRYVVVDFSAIEELQISNAMVKQAAAPGQHVLQAATAPLFYLGWRKPPGLWFDADV